MRRLIRRWGLRRRRRRSERITGEGKGMVYDFTRCIKYGVRGFSCLAVAKILLAGLGVGNIEFGNS
jgi:hypothetical protein